MQVLVRERRMPDISSMIDVGVDMFGKYQTPASGASKVEPSVLKKVLNENISGEKLQGLMDSFSQIGRSGKEPDFGQIFSTLMANFNPEKLQKTLEAATKSASGSAPPEAAPPAVPEKKVITEEVIEEIEEITETIEEIHPVPPGPSVPSVPSGPSGPPPQPS